MSNKEIAIFVSIFSVVGLTLGLFFGPKILKFLNSLFKPIIYFFTSNGVYLGLKLLSFIQFELHNPHHGTAFHFVIRIFIDGKWKEIFEWLS